MGAKTVGAPPRVSVVVPVRNRRSLLRVTLDALARQTFGDYEVIVVDDGSDDGSDQEALADEEAGRPVRLVHGRRRGAVAAREAGVAVSAGGILAFTDSDCRPDPHWLERGVAAIDRGADVVQGLTRPTRQPRPLERTVWSLRDDGLFATCNVFYRRDAFEAAGGFDATAGDLLGFRPGAALRDLGFGEDTLLGWRVRRAGRAAFAPDAIVEHHVFGVDVADSLRRAWTVGAFAELFRAVPELIDLLGPELRRTARRRAPLYVGVVAGVAGRRRLAGVALASFVTDRWVQLGRSEPSLVRRLKVLPVDLAVEAVSAASLLVGSVRARHLLV